MAEELLVTLNRSDSTGLGFSLLGTPGLPHVIYDIVENSPAADSGKVEAGDIILGVNEVDVNRFSTKEVLKCLRLSSDPVTLKLRRDPEIKARVRRLLTPGPDENCVDGVDGSLSVGIVSEASTTAALQTRDSTSRSSSRGKSSSDSPTSTANNCTGLKHSRSNGSCGGMSASVAAAAVAAAPGEIEGLVAPQQPQLDSFKEEERAQWEPLGTDKFSRQKNTPRFEAYMMTGDLMLNLSRTQQSSGLLPKHQKKVDSLMRYSNNLQNHQNTHHHQHHYHHHHFAQHNNRQNPSSDYQQHKNNNGTTSSSSNNSSSSNGTADNNHLHHQYYEHHNSSVPTSPNDEQHQNQETTSNSTTNPSLVKQSSQEKASTTNSSSSSSAGSGAGSSMAGQPFAATGAGFVRTSRSEDQLQFQKDPCMSAVAIDIDDDVTSSLNTLLDTRAESCGGGLSSERIVWTYNAPVSGGSAGALASAGCCQQTNGSSSSEAGSRSSSGSNSSTSPQRSLSPASPTSVSSSVMSSNSGSRRFPQQQQQHQHQHQQHQRHHQHNHQQQQHYLQQQGSFASGAQNGDCSQSEAISNMSSPDYNDEETMDILSARDVMMVSDPSDSDSTILASEAPQRLKQQQQQQQQSDEQHRIVIQVKGPEMAGGGSPRQSRANGHDFAGYQELRDLKEADREHYGLGSYDDQRQGATSPPHSADEESDIESLHSFHYSPKAVDLPSAIRLAKRLYSLDGFKKSDVSRHLSKNNDFSRAVAEEYLRYFNFERDTLDVALRKFLAQFSLTGETQERERVLVHFSKRYLDCNPGSFNSQDAVHTLTCAIMLLNTDLHGQNIGRKMSCSEFIENLAELNDGGNFPREVLKQLYNAIKSFPLEWATDEDRDDLNSQAMQQGDGSVLSGSGNPFLDVPNIAGATEFKKGYVMRKCCHDANGKKTPFGKRGWKMYYCTLRELVLYLHKDEHGFRSDSLHNAIRIHHALATKASDYTKKQHVFRLQTADQAEYLFQTSDSKELQSWIDTINFVCASFSSQPLAGAVGSQRKFQRPLLPCSHTKLSPREQLRDHEDRVNKLEIELDEHRRHPPERGSKALAIQNYKEKDAYLHHELKRYKTYAYLLRSRLAYTEIEPSLVESSIGEVDESGAFLNMDVALVPPPVPDRPVTNRVDSETT